MNRSLRTCVLSTPLFPIGLALVAGCADPSANGPAPHQLAAAAAMQSVASEGETAPATLQVSAAARPLDRMAMRTVGGGWIEQTAAALPRGTIRGIASPNDAAEEAIREPLAAAFEVARLPATEPLETPEPSRGTWRPNDAAGDGPALAPPAAEAPKNTPYTPAEIPFEPKAELPAPQLPSPPAQTGEQTWRLDDQVRHVPPPQAEFEPSPTPSMRSADDGAALRAVAERADELVRHGYSLGQRGAYFSARAELIQSLRLVAQALDAQQGGDAHSAALARGMQALEEADDFAPKGTRLEADLNVAQIAKTHRTPVLKTEADAAVSPLMALQRYYTYAQQQLTTAGGELPVASHALYCLGKIQTVLADATPESQRLQGPKAMTFYQSALLVHGGNYLAANELGVMLARYGQLQDARRVLLHSVATRPHVEGWHNLAVVHARLGEHELAQRADYERQLLASQQGNPGGTKSPLGEVQWVDARSFASHGVSDQTTASVASATRNSTITTAKQPGNHQR